MAMHIFTEHFKKDHLLARADARVKILLGLAVLIMVLTYKGFLFPVVTAGLCLGICISLKVPARVILFRFSEPLFLAGVVIILKVLFAGKEMLFSVNFFGLDIIFHRDGLVQGLLIATRIIGAVSVVAAVGFSTPFTEFLAGLSWLRLPRGFIEILMFAYRYIFVLLDDATVIYSAQKNRLGYSTIRRGLSSFGVLAGSLTLKAFDNSQATAVAMVQRGYDGNMPLLNQRSFRLSEVVLSALFLTGMGLLWRI
jgi:cobalt/nickel transport system permease protein